ncbi:MAG: rhamnulokinase [Anaerolineaceae bacterium]|nr:rhamnulokinase [Anaerolineaceae bacterium]
MNIYKDVLAIDIGAESGRAILGRYENGKLVLKEIHRFLNKAVRLPDGLHWDLLYLLDEIKTGIKKAADQYGDSLLSAGIDTWGVDHALLDHNDSLTFLPFHYRDSRTDGLLEEAYKVVPKKNIFERTGLQFMSINTLYQLLSLVKVKSPALASAETFLTIPDLLNFWLTGKKVCEFSIATTTQCYDPRKGDWAFELIEKLGIPTSIFPEIVPSGTILGPLLSFVQKETGAANLIVIAPACHDTGSAVLSVPAKEKGAAFISSGTWSLIGMEVDEPLITEESQHLNFTNEGGFSGNFRFLKNITGLWLIQECRRYWKSNGEDLDYEQITSLAEAASPLVSFINTDEAEFIKPGNMPIKIQEFCEQSGQTVPETKGEIVRCVLESLSMKYRDEFSNLERISKHRIETLHIVGGGTQNRLLNQFTANSLNRKVITGPVEATAVGNILGQLIALGEIESVNSAREVVRNSFTLEEYLPEKTDEWAEAYRRYSSGLGHS